MKQLDFEFSELRDVLWVAAVDCKAEVVGRSK
jgi:hypothetical protein